MLSILAIFIIIIGLIMVPLPIPFGLFFVLMGLTLLLSVNPGARQILKRLRRRYPGLNQWMLEATKRAPRFVRFNLHKTRYRSPSAANRML